jgi:DNA mismatch repair protein MutS
MGHIDRYFELEKKHLGEYGDKSVLVMQFGSFYEMYGIRTKDGRYCETAIEEWARVSDLNIAKKANVSNLNVLSKYDGGSLVMIGCKLEQLDKYVPRFQRLGYTLVIYDQDPNDKQKREFSYAISPGTMFSTEETARSNNVMCVWCEGYRNTFLTRNSRNGRLLVGVAVIDSLTGKASISEFAEEFKQEMHTTYNELERLVSIYQPRELIFISNLERSDMQDILKFVQSGCTTSHVHSLHKPVDDPYTQSCLEKITNSERQSYQEAILVKTFNPTDPVQFMERYRDNPVGTQALTYLLDFVSSRNPKLLEKISEPTVAVREGRLVLENHSLRQLNIIEDGHKGKYSSVLKLLNKASTNMGKRRIDQCLLNPTTQIIDLEKEYEATKVVQEAWGDFSVTRERLREVCDLDKMQRMFVMEKVPFPNLASLVRTCECVSEVASGIESSQYLPAYLDLGEKVPDVCAALSSEVRKMFNIEECLQLSLPTKLTNGWYGIQMPDVAVRPGADSELDSAVESLREEIGKLQSLQDYLCHVIHEIPTEGRTRAVRINETEKQGFSLTTSKKRSELLEKAQRMKTMPDLPHPRFRFIQEEGLTTDIKIKPCSNKSDVTLNHPVIAGVCQNICTLREKIQTRLAAVYAGFVEGFKSNVGRLGLLSEYVARLDSITTKAYVASKYNYCMPKLAEGEKSFVDAKGLRHCLIEHISTSEAYVANDVALGVEGEDTCQGFLLFGTNTVGKTSLIRALGISVVMAQAGFFVPCSSMTLCPYQQIFTRILNTDNLFRGQSTFMVEMCELRRILMRGNSKSLVLGDELCSGTEIDSAISLFAAGLVQLHEIGATFIFATHLHMITSQPELLSLPRLKNKHLTVEYDAERNTLVYDRKLKDGQGSTLYGLEVCKSLDLPEEFIRLANQIRETNCKTVLSKKQSRYNSVVKDRCAFCGKDATAIHHLLYQCDADRNGFVRTEDGTFHMNHPANTVPICEGCHLKVHQEDRRYVQKKTDQGMSLVEKSVE